MKTLAPFVVILLHSTLGWSAPNVSVIGPTGSFSTANSLNIRRDAQSSPSGISYNIHICRSNLSDCADALVSPADQTDLSLEHPQKSNANPNNYFASITIFSTSQLLITVTGIESDVPQMSTIINAFEKCFMGMKLGVYSHLVIGGTTSARPNGVYCSTSPN